ncbi:hypothetical protein EcoAe3A3_31580 [Escherichia coli]|nr:hypothetical protein EcoAe3A3_31580 [Escherichia coli]
MNGEGPPSPIQDIHIKKEIRCANCRCSRLDWVFGRQCDRPEMDECGSNGGATASGWFNVSNGRAI